MIQKRFQTLADVEEDVPVIGCVIYGVGITILGCVGCENRFNDRVCRDIFLSGRSQRLVGVVEDI